MFNFKKYIFWLLPIYDKSFTSVQMWCASITVTAAYGSPHAVYNICTGVFPETTSECFMCYVHEFLFMIFL